MPVLHKQQESQTPRGSQLPLVSSPISHESSVQCGLIFQEQFSMARCASFPSMFALLTLFLCLLLLGCDGGRAWILRGNSSVPYPCLCVFSSSPGVDALFCSLQVIVSSSGVASLVCTWDEVFTLPFCSAIFSWNSVGIVSCLVGIKCKLF